MGAASEALTRLTHAFDKTASRPASRRGRVIPPPGLHEGVVLFACAFRRAAAPTLFEGLAPQARAEARKCLSEMEELPSVRRQARIATFFGEREDGKSRLRALMADAGPELQNALYRCLPPYQRNLLPAFVPSRREGEQSPRVHALAVRLLKEALG